MRTLVLIVLLASCGPFPPLPPLIDGAPDEDATSGPDAGRDSQPPPDGGAITEGMVVVPAGPFWRGCNPDNPNPYPCSDAILARESPYRQITLSEFWIDTFEVTQEQWALCVEYNACDEPEPIDPKLEGAAGYDPANKPDHPVSNITWGAARAYCQWIGKRLPTEAEWEKAARGDDGRMLPWGSDVDSIDCEHVNAGTCGEPSGTHAIGTHPLGVSPYGAHDMIGNVEEYTADFYDAAYYAASPTTDPQGPLAGTGRSVRGSGFPHGSATSQRIPYRSTSGGSTGISYARGFRCAWSDP